MMLKFNIEVDLKEIHIDLIKELMKKSSYVHDLEMKGFHFTSIADLCYEGIAGRNHLDYVWLTALGKQVYNQL